MSSLPKRLSVICNRYSLVEGADPDDTLNGFVDKGGKINWGELDIPEGAIGLKGGVFEVLQPPTQAQATEMWRVCEENSPRIFVSILCDVE